jgi:hypothetical protein
MSQEDLVKRSLAALWKGTTAGGTISTTVARSCTAARSATGVVAITLDPSPSYDANIDSTQCSMDLVMQSTTAAGSIVDTSGTVKTVTCTSLATPTVGIDVAFEAKIYRLFPAAS